MMKKLLASCLLLCLFAVSMAEAREKFSPSGETFQKTYLNEIPFLKGQKKRVFLAESSPRGIDQVQNILSLGNFSGREMSDESFSLVGTCRRSLQRRGTLEERLEGCPWFAEQIIWETPDGEEISYPDWPEDKKDRLNEIFERILRDETDLGLRCQDSRATDSLLAYLTEEQAFDIYAAHVAHVFYLEATRSVPWSILNSSDREFLEFFSSKRFHVPILASERSRVPRGVSFKIIFERLNAVICDPRVGYRFLRGLNSTSGANLIGNTPEETMENITLWTAQNIVHDISGSYPGRTRSLQGRLQVGDRVRRHIPADRGSRTAAPLIYDLAKSVNIPLIPVNYSDLHPNELASNDVRQGHPLRSFLEMTDRGLIFNWGRPGIKMLYYVDLLYALNALPSFTVDEEGREMTGRDFARKLFQVTWISPEELESWGFHYLRDVPEVISGMGYGLYNRNSNGLFIPYESFGYFIGYFLRDGEGRSPEYSDLRTRHFFEQKYQLCSWEMFLEYYCELADHVFDLQLRTMAPFTPSSSRLPVTRTPGDFYRRAALCINAYGGCATAVRRAQEWRTRIQGSNVWQD